MGLADLLKSARAAKGLAQDDAGEKLGVSRLTYRSWEKGWTQPADPEAWRKVAEYCNVPYPVILHAVGVLTDEELAALMPAAWLVGGAGDAVPLPMGHVPTLPESWLPSTEMAELREVLVRGLNLGAGNAGDPAKIAPTRVYLHTAVRPAALLVLPSVADPLAWAS